MQELSDFVYESVENEFDERLKTRRPQIVSAVMLWLTTEARVKNMPDTDQRVADLQRRVTRMVEGMRVVLEEGKLVVKVNGSDEDTFKMFRLGTSWFAPHPEPHELFLVGFFDERT